MKIACWNVNGIRAVAKKGFFDWLKKNDADIVCLQETKAFQHQLEPVLKYPPPYQYSVWHAGERPGYSGTVIYTKDQPLKEVSHFGDDLKCFHQEGRVVEVKFPQFHLLNIYFPNGQPTANGVPKLPFKMDFYNNFIQYIKDLRAQGESVIVCGDFNICHTEIDIARPKENWNSIGFTEGERAKLSEVVDAGFIDVFRHFHPEETDHYTWWSYRGGARERNVGWRIDYFFVSPDLIDKVKSIKHQTDQMGSDHCPLVMEIDV